MNGAQFKPILDLAREMGAIERRAAEQYQPVVDDILRTGTRDAEHIERTLDGLLELCGHEPVLAMYRQLCRYYWDIDPVATAYHVNAYRERWDSDEQEGES